MNTENKTKKAHIKPQVKIICMEPNKILASSSYLSGGGIGTPVGGTTMSFD